MVYRLSYYNETVEAELDAWPVGLRARYRALTLRMEEYGPNLGMPHTRRWVVAFLKSVPRLGKVLEESFSAPWSGERSLFLTASLKRRTKHQNGNSI
jgi:hypothetical protein